MAIGSYVGSSNGIRPTTSSGYVNLDYGLNPNKTIKLEMMVRFTDVTTFSCVFGNHYTTNTSPNFSFGVSNGKWWWIRFGYYSKDLSSLVVDTWYKVTFIFENGNQKFLINDTEISSSTYGGKTGTSPSWYMFCRNDSTLTAATTCSVRYVKIWENNQLVRNYNVYVPHSSDTNPSYTKWSFHEDIQNKFYDISGQISYFYAKARKIKKIYVGVSNKARKVKKVYVGVNGKAKICYLLNGGVFSGTPVPTVWDDSDKSSTAAANTEYTATNSYGTWKCYADVKSKSKCHAHNLFGNEQYQGANNEWSKYGTGSRFCIFGASKWSTNSTKIYYIVAI